MGRVPARVVALGWGRWVRGRCASGAAGPATTTTPLATDLGGGGNDAGDDAEHLGGAVVVRGIPDVVGDELVRTYFAQFGGVPPEVAVEREAGKRDSGTAWVEWDDAAAAVRAVQFGRHRWAVPPPLPGRRPGPEGVHLARVGRATAELAETGPGWAGFGFGAGREGLLGVRVHRLDASATLAEVLAEAARCGGTDVVRCRLARTRDEAARAGRQTAEVEWGHVGPAARAMHEGRWGSQGGGGSRPFLEGLFSSDGRRSAAATAKISAGDFKVAVGSDPVTRLPDWWRTVGLLRDWVEVGALPWSATAADVGRRFGAALGGARGLEVVRVPGQPRVTVRVAWADTAAAKEAEDAFRRLAGEEGRRSPERVKYVDASERFAWDARGESARRARDAAKAERVEAMEAQAVQAAARRAANREAQAAVAAEAAARRAAEQEVRARQQEEERKAKEAADRTRRREEEKVRVAEAERRAAARGEPTRRAAEEKKDAEAKEDTEAKKVAAEAAAARFAQEEGALVEAGGRPTHRILVGSLHPAITDADFRAHFEAFGTSLVRCQVARTSADPASPSRGFGYVEWASPDDAARVLAATHAFGPDTDRWEAVLGASKPFSARKVYGRKRSRDPSIAAIGNKGAEEDEEKEEAEKMGTRHPP